MQASEVKSYDVVGYHYDGAFHCVDCTKNRFGPTLEDCVDREGNPLYRFFADEAKEVIAERRAEYDSEGRPEWSATVCCNRCGVVIYKE